MNRRLLLRSTGLIAAALIVSAGSCTSGAPPAAQITQIIATANAIVAGIDKAASAPAVVVLFQPAQLAKVRAAIEQAKALIAGLNAALPDTTNATALQAIQAYAQAALDVLVTVPLPPPYGSYIVAADVLLPIVSAFVTSVIPQAPAAAAKTTRAMTTDQAKAVLKAP